MRPRYYFLIAGLMVFIIALGYTVSPAAARPTFSGANGSDAPRPAAANNEACLACHQNPQFSVTLGNGDLFDLSVNPDEFNHSVHGETKIACVQCHVGFEPGAGHGLKFGSRREATLQLNTTCGQCHKQQADQEKDSVHAAARSVGQLKAAICTDCHTSHAVQRIKDPTTHQLLPTTRIWIPTTCQKCHSAIYEKYRNSVHGAALTDGNNPDVPTCIDCHGVHIIENPTTSTFRLFSPQICAKCHTDPKRMDKYNISTQVLNTYVADFHGTTDTIFQKVSPDAITNKPVCYDCHGIHDITRVDDPVKGLQVKANLLTKCQKCHPDANTNFPEAWLSHYIPSPDKYPMVYYINLFYKFLIPGVLIPMGVLVVMDFSRMMINRFRKPQLTKIHKKLKHPKTGELVEETEESTESTEEASVAEEANIPEPPAEPETDQESAPAEKPDSAESTDEEARRD